jgi:hypothetical protein
MQCRRVALVFVLWFVAVPRHAEAQWFAAGYLGANATRSATVGIDVPGEQISLEYHDVAFEARPFESPQYYGVRVGRMFGAATRFGVEVEWVHLKVYADTTRVYETTGSFGSSLILRTPEMNAIVQRYAMSHGLNFLVVNLVTRYPLGRAVSLIARAGAGPTLPHGETTVLDQQRDRYEYAGLGVHAAAGLDVRLYGRLSLVGEYKFTYARPEIDLAAGTGRTTTASHHVAFGLAFGLTR